MTWTAKPLGDVLTFQRGFDITKADQSPGPFWVISSSGPNSKHNQFKVKGPGVVIGRKGTLGTAFYSAADYWPHDTTLWVKDFHGNDQRFAYYFVQTMGFEKFDVGASNPTLNRSHIHVLPVRWPDSLGTQRRIASILCAYDDLIENNTRRIAILEEMARRIYEEWFVRFRFPGHEGVRMVESELGLVPESWSVQGLYDVADLTYGFPFKSNLFKEGGEGLGVIRIRDTRDDYTATRTTEDVDLKYRVADGDILVGMDGAFHMGRWAGGVAWLNQRVVRLRPKARIPRSWLFWVTEEPIKTLEATIVGTTVAHLSARDLKEMRVLVPSKAVLEAAGSVLEPMSDLELTLKKKNAVLRVTRDLLLPKLISGELDVSAMPEPEALAA